MTAPAFHLPCFYEVPEPTLQFHPDRENDTDVHPLRGLLRFGPYSRATPLSAPDPIRLAVVCPDDKFQRVQHLVSEFQREQRPRERQQYLESFPGFSKTFGIGIDFPASVTDQRVITLPKTDITAALTSGAPPEKLAELLHSAMRRFVGIRTHFDVLLLYLPDELSIGFHSPPEDELADFDLHDSVKALSSSLQIPLQVLNDRALSYFCRCSVAWRLSLAIYTKAGGIPWKLAGFEDRQAYVGLSYCLRKAGKNRFVTCCSQIFDARGTNLQFLLYESHDGQYDGDNPFVPREDMRRVMVRTLDLYQRGKGAPPSRLVVHKTTQFTRDEIDGCTDALARVDDLELITLTDRTSWQGIKIEPPNRNGTKGQPSPYPLERGTMLPLGPFEFLLWTQGNCLALGKGNYFKEGKGIPRPVRITRHLGTVGFHESAREILGLSKMNWNNDSLYDVLPVTISYASILARIVKRMGSLSNTPYDFRFFM